MLWDRGADEGDDAALTRVGAADLVNVNGDDVAVSKARGADDGGRCGGIGARLAGVDGWLCGVNCRAVLFYVKLCR